MIHSIKILDENIGLDLIITARLNNEIQEDVFLDRIVDSVIKRTNISVLVSPLEKPFNPSKRMLITFKTGKVKASSTLNPLVSIQNQFKSKLNLLLVKLQGFSRRNHKLNDEVIQRSEYLLYSENATVYQGVLEHFKTNQPDLLVTFIRECDFF